MAAPATEPQTEPYRLSDPEQPTPVTLTFQTTAQDPELRTIEATLQLLQLLPYETRVRALNYIRDRVMSDPAVWGGGHPEPPPAPERVTDEEIAGIIADADGREWTMMTSVEQSVYYRRAQALHSAGIDTTRDR